MIPLLMDCLNNAPIDNDVQRYRFAHGIIPAAIVESATDATQTFGRLVDQLTEVLNILGEAIEDKLSPVPTVDLENWYQVIGAWLARQEALTLVENYLQSLCPQFNVSRVLGEYLEGYSIHHQLLSASYSVGGPSAGFALAINTLSVLLCLPVLNDFGITGAPWIKGAQRGEVGASVIIGGHRKKAEKVLQYLPRMYMPLQNYQDLEPEVLEAYRLEGRDIRGVRSFSALVAEVFYFGEDYDRRLSSFLQRRREIDLGLGSEEGGRRLGEEQMGIEQDLRNSAENVVRRRIEALRRHVEQGDNGFISHEEVLAGDPAGGPRPVRPTIKGLSGGGGKS
jgi:hypothetical protein